MKESPRPAPVSPRAAAIGLGLLALVNLFNYLDRFAVTVVAQPLKKHFGLSDTQLGFLNGPAFVAVYIVASLIFGRLVDRFDRRRVLALALTLWSGMTMLGGVANSYLALVIARAGVGVGEGGSNPAGFSLLADLYPMQRRSFAVAIHSALGMVGILASLAIGGIVAAHYGWRAAFFVAGAPGLVLALCILLFMPDPGRGTFDRAAFQRLSTGEATRLLIQVPGLMGVIFGMGFTVFASLGMIQWLSLFFIRSHHMSLTQVGLFFGPALSIGLIAGMLIGGRVGDRLARRSLADMLWPSILGQAAIVPLFWAVLWVDSLPLALGLTMVAAALSVFHTPAIAATVHTIAPASARGTAVAIYNLSAGLLGQALLPFLVGVLSDRLAPGWGADGLRVALSIVIATALIGSLLLLRSQGVLKREHPPTS